MNPKAIAMYATFAILMAGAITLGQWWVIGVGSLTILYTLYAISYS